jgi:hypothetical protein
VPEAQETIRRKVDAMMAGSAAVAAGDLLARI